MSHPLSLSHLQQAYKQNMFGAGYFWLLVGWYNSNWYTEENGALECTTEQMAEAVESSMYISTQARLLGGENVTTISGIVRFDLSPFFFLVSGFLNFPGDHITGGDWV